MKARAVVWTAPRHVEVQDVEVTAPGPGELLIQHAVSLVSPGTEAEWLASDESHAVIDTTFPFVPGYSRAGWVKAVGEGVSEWVSGDRVVAPFDRAGRPIFAHASHSVVRAVDVDRVPDGVAFDDAVFFLLGQAAAYVVMRGGVGLSGSVAIVGQGPIGNLAVQFARESGAREIVALDLVEARRDAARKVGATIALDPARDAEVAEYLVRTGGVDTAIDLSGAEAGTNLAIRLAAEGGTVVLSTGYGGRMSLDYGAMFVKGLTVLGGYVNAMPERARVATRAYLQLVADGSIDLTTLRSEPIDPNDAPAVYERILAHDSTLRTPLFRWATDQD